MANVKVKCEHCGSVLDAEDSMVGVTATCPTCSKDFVIKLQPSTLRLSKATVDAPAMDPEMAKQLGKAAVKGGLDAITGKKDTTAILNLLVMGYRILGVANVIAAIMQGWFYQYIAASMELTTDSRFLVWLKVTGIGLVIGLSTWAFGELINLLVKMEGHLRRIASKDV